MDKVASYMWFYSDNGRISATGISENKYGICRYLILLMQRYMSIAVETWAGEYGSIRHAIK